MNLEVYANKADQFVDHLLGNPSLQSLNIIQKEEQILQFLAKNEAALTPTLSSPNYFPGMDWRSIYSLLQAEINTRVNNTLFKELSVIIHDKIDLSFVRDMWGVSDDIELKTQLYKMVCRFVKKMNTRIALTNAYNAVYFRIPERYIHEIFHRKAYIHFEITKVQRLRLDSDQLIGMLYVTLLLKPAVLLMNPDIDINAITTDLHESFVQKTLTVFKNSIPTLPEEIFRSAINSNISFYVDRFIEATSRLGAIFTARSYNYHPNIKVDRGADSPDKSWFGIARRNFKYYGFDGKMIDELYSIASERGW